jgi:transcriptional regulator GlxA family with amidase domain
MSQPPGANGVGEGAVVADRFRVSCSGVSPWCDQLVDLIQSAVPAA